MNTACLLMAHYNGLAVVTAVNNFAMRHGPV